VAAELLKGDLRVEAGKASLLETRKQVERGWWAVSDMLVAEAQPELAAQVRRFSNQMPVPRTDKELIAAELIQRTRQPRVSDQRPTR
jgi:hypothetical protein